MPLSHEEMTSGQCRMARAALKMGVRELAELARVSTNTVTRFEQNELLRSRTVEALQRALEASGAVFVDGDSSAGPGVRFAPWHSDQFALAMKKGLQPPRLLTISEKAIRLEAFANDARITANIDREAFAKRIGYNLDDRELERAILS